VFLFSYLLSTFNPPAIMNLKTSILIFILGCYHITTASAQKSLDNLIDKEIPSLVSTYKMLHASPELSTLEEKTSAFLAKELRSLGYDVTDHIGQYSTPGHTGYGVAAVMKNGEGPVVLIRTDMDALPVVEKTGLPYASTVISKNDDGHDVGVMHACGHDIHMTCFLGTAKMLVELKDQWHGTVILVGQPAEEIVSGARAMLHDGFYTRFPKPDFAIALHDHPFEAGKVGIHPGYIQASASNVTIIIRGIGGHGSKPEAAKDPIVVAAQVVLALQTIVSREISPFDPAVVTVGSIHGGTRANIIPDEVKLQLTIRSYEEEVRKKILESISRITINTALAAGIPKELAPIISLDSIYTSATYNDPALTERITTVLKNSLGSENVLDEPPLMGSEDFGLFGLDGHRIPTCMFFLGATDPAIIAQSKQNRTALPGLHSPLFAPLPEPTIRTGVKAMTSVILELMKK
jgi:amidohydrolase